MALFPCKLQLRTNESPGVPGLSLHDGLEKFGGDLWFTVVQVPVSDAVAGGVEGELGFRIIGRHWFWRKGLFFRGGALIEMQQLQVKEQMRFLVLDIGCNAREHLRGRGLIARASQRHIEPIGTINHAIVRARQAQRLAERFGGLAELALEIERETEMIEVVELLRV